MRASARIAVVILMLCAPIKCAAGGVNLAWNACASEGGASSMTFACNSNQAVRVLIGSFAPNEGHDNVIGFEAVLNISAASDSLPAWWSLYGSGACRQSVGLSASFGSEPATACEDPWGGQVVGGIGALHTYWTSPRVPGQDPATAQLSVVGAAPQNMSTNVLAGVEYYGFRLSLNSQKTVGTGACGGCSTPVCVSLSNFRLVMSDNSKVDISSALSSRTVAWQQTSPSCPAAVDLKGTTWGQTRAVFH